MIDAIAVRIGVTLGGIPETRIVEPMPLPAVATAPLPARTQVIPNALDTTPAPAAAAQAKTVAF